MSPEPSPERIARIAQKAFDAFPGYEDRDTGDLYLYEQRLEPLVRFVLDQGAQEREEGTMSVGDLTVAEMTGNLPCNTPACGLAEVWRIGRRIRLICQRCGGDWAVSRDEYATRVQVKTTSGVALIAAERLRQVTAEGWTPAHDDAHSDGELLAAAARYLDAGSEYDLGGRLPEWPFEPSWWKPSDDLPRNLVKAGALIAAEIDRQRRQGAQEPGADQPVSPSRIPPAGVTDDEFR